MRYFSQDTIAQVSSPPARSPLGVLRISGPLAFATMSGLCSGPGGGALPFDRRGIHRGRFRLRLSFFAGNAAREGEFPCPAVIMAMPKPGSYTREDVAEIHLPGSPAIMKAGLRTLTSRGVRPASPGEFTFRAFRNGRLSLGQAEAVERMIRAGNEEERRDALAGLGGGAARAAEGWRRRLLELSAAVEASLDFDAGEPGEDPAAGLAGLIAELEREGLETASGREAAELGRNAPEVALAGLANAGKSSLFNALIGESRSLVSPERSTTRDALGAEIEADGVRFALFDNPGFDPGGAGGGGAAADRAAASLGKTGIVCWVVDASRKMDSAAREFAARLPRRVVLVRAKTDLPRAMDLNGPEALLEGLGVGIAASHSVSSADGTGIAGLRAGLAAMCRRMELPGAWNRRERWELLRGLDACRRAALELSGAGRLELAAADLRDANAAVGRALGEGYAEELLERVFSRFCLGK